MGKINVDLAFTANTSAAKAQLDQLKNSLTQLGNMTHIDLGTKQMTSDLAEASNAALRLKTQLDAATNVNTGKLSLGKFNQELKTSGMSLSDYRQKLASLGPEGQKAFIQLTDSIISADKALSTGSKLLGNFAQTLANVAKYQFSTAVYRGFTTAISTAYNYAQDLNKSLTNIRIVTGQSLEQMDKFAEKANKAAKALSTTTTAYTDAALIFYQQGLNDKEVEKRTNVTIKMMNVTGQSAEDASSQMTAIWNNFAKGSENLEYYADVITKLGASTASSSKEIAEGLQKFAAIADTVGLSYEYATTGLATVVAQTRQSADVVGTAFKTLFARIQDLDLGKTLEDGTTLGKYAQALKTIGVNVKTSTGELKDMDTILSELGAKWNTLSDATKIATAQTVAGQRQYAQLMALMDNWDKFQENLAIARTSEGELNTQAEKYAESWEGAKKRVQAAAESIYKALLNDKAFISITNGIGKVVESISVMIKGLGGLKGIIPLVTGLLLQFAGPQIYNGLHKLTTEFTNLLPNFKAWGANIAQAQGGNNKIKAFLSPTTFGETRSDKIRNEAIQEQTQVYEKDHTLYGNMARENISQKVTLQQQFANISSKLTQEQKEYYQLLLDSSKAINTEVEEKAQSVVETEREMKLLREKIQLQRESNKEDREDDQNSFDQDVENYKSQDAFLASSRHNKKDFKKYFNIDLTDHATKAEREAALAAARQKHENLGNSIATTVNTDLGYDPNDENSVAGAMYLQRILNTIPGERISSYGAHAAGNYGSMTSEIDSLQMDYVNAATMNSEVLGLNGESDIDLLQQKLEILQSLSNETGSYSNEVQTLATALKELQDAENQDGITTEELTKKKEQVTNAINKFGEAQKVADKKYQSQAAKAGKKDLDAYKDTTEKVNKAQDKSRKSNEDLNKSIDKRNKKFKQAEAEMKKMSKQNQTVGQSFMSITKGATQLASGIQMLQGLGSIWSNDDISTGQKILTTITSIGMALPMVLNGTKELMGGVAGLAGKIVMLNAAKKLESIITDEQLPKIATELINRGLLTEAKKQEILADKENAKGKLAEIMAANGLTISKGAETGAHVTNTASIIAEETAAWPLLVVMLLIVAAAAVLIAIVAIITTAIKNHEKALKHDQVQMEEANAAVEKQTELVNEAKQAWDDLISGLENYHKALDAINSLTVGTTEYAEAVKKLNEEVLALMEKYPNLETHWENGHLIIDNEKEALEALEEEYNKQNQISNSAKLNETSATTTYNRTYAIQTNVDKNYTGDGHYLNTTFDKIDAAFRSGNEEVVQAQLNQYTKNSSDYNAVKQYIDAQRPNLTKEQAIMSISNTQLATNSVELKDLDSTSDEYQQIMTALSNQKFNAKKHNDAVQALKNEHKLSHDENYEIGGFKDRAARAVLIMQYGQDPDKIVHNGTGNGRDTWTGPTARIRHGYAANYTVDIWDEEKQQWSEGKSNEFAWTDAAETTISYEEGKERATNIDKNIQQIRQKRNNINNTISNTVLKDLSNKGINNIINGLLDDNNTLNFSNLSDKDQDLLMRAIEANPNLIEELATISGIKTVHEIETAISSMKTDKIIAQKEHNKDVFKNWKQNQKDNIDKLIADNFELPKNANFTDIRNNLIDFYKESTNVSEDAAFGIVEANQKIVKSINDISESYITNTTVLHNSKKGTREYAAALSGLQNTLNSAFSGVTFDDAFVESNLDLIEKIAKGDFNAYRELGQKAGQEFLKAEIDAQQSPEVTNYLTQLTHFFEKGGNPTQKTVNGLNSILSVFGPDKVKQLAEYYGYIVAIDEQTNQITEIKFSDTFFDESQLAALADSLKAEYDQYYYINKQITQAEKNTEKLNNIKDKAYGKNRLNAIDAENNSLNNQIKLQKQLIKQATNFSQEAQAKIISQAADLGIDALFDEYGNLINYMEIMEAFGPTDTDAKKHFEEALSKYEEHLEKIQDAQDKIQDNQDKILSNNYEKYTYEIEIKVTINENDKKYIDYFLEKLEDDIYKVAEATQYLSQQQGILKTALTIQGDAYDKLEQQYKNGEISQADYIDGLQNIYDTTLDNLEALNEYDEKMKTYYSDTLQKGIEKIDEYIDRLDKQTSLLEHYQNLLKLSGKEFDYDKQLIVLNGLVEQARLKTQKINQEVISLEKARANAIKELAAAQSEESRKFWEEELARINDLLAEKKEAQIQAAEDELEALSNAFETFREKELKAIENEVTDGLGFKNIQQQLQNIKELADIWLDDTNKTYETNKMLRDISKAIDKTNNQAAKNRYKAFADDIKQMANKEKLTKGELELAQSRYKVLQAQIALEEAQNAKSVVRLKRDNEGNFGYVYTADENKIADAEQKADDAENAYYNTRLKLARDSVEKLNTINEEHLNRLKDLNDKFRSGEIADEETYNRLVAEENKRWLEEREGYMIIYQAAMGNRNDPDSLYGKLSAGEISVQDTVLEANDRMDESTQTHWNNINDKWNETKTTIDNVTASLIGSGDGGLQKAVDDVNDSSQDLADTIGDQSSGLVKAINDAANAAYNLTSQWSTQLTEIQKLRDYYEQTLLPSIRDAIKKQQELNDLTGNNNKTQKTSLGDYNLAYLSDESNPHSEVAYYLDTNGNLWSAKDVERAQGGNGLAFKAGHENAKTYNSLKASLDAKAKQKKKKANDGSQDGEPDGLEINELDKQNAIANLRETIKKEKLGENQDININDKNALIAWLQQLYYYKNTREDANKLTFQELLDANITPYGAQHIPAAQLQLALALQDLAKNNPDYIAGERYIPHQLDESKRSQSQQINVYDLITEANRAAPYYDDDGNLKGLRIFESNNQTYPYYDFSLGIIRGKTYLPTLTTSNTQQAIEISTKIIELLNNFPKSSLPTYDTGGYTGQWGPSGKLAMLHQKEIVLNADDTANFLQAIDILRSIVSVIDLGAIQAMTGSMVASSVNTSSNSLNQNVTIHAEFPNAVNHNEIEQAFDNLVNKASQYANRY